MAIKVLQDALPMYGAASEEGQTIVKVLGMLGKMAQPGDVSQAGEGNQLQKMMMALAQRGQQQKQMQQSSGAAPGTPPTPQAAAA